MKQLDINVLKEIVGGDSVTCYLAREYFGDNNESLFSASITEKVNQGFICDPSFATIFMDDLRHEVNINRGGYVNMTRTSALNSRTLDFHVVGSADAIAKTLPSI